MAALPQIFLPENQIRHQGTGEAFSLKCALFLGADRLLRVTSSGTVALFRAPIPKKKDLHSVLPKQRTEFPFPALNPGVLRPKIAKKKGTGGQGVSHLPLLREKALFSTPPKTHHQGRVGRP